MFKNLDPGILSGELYDFMAIFGGLQTLIFNGSLILHVKLLLYFGVIVWLNCNLLS